MKVSVVIPFYNLERYVGPCLDSVAAASRRLGADAPLSIEAICVDDGSTDGTAAALDARAVDDSSVHVVHKPNGGEGSARNTGVDAATGEWVTFLDGDDVWLDNHLEEALPLLASHPDADMVALAFAPFYDGKPPPPHSQGETSVFSTDQSIADEVMLDVGVFPTFYRREFLAGARFSALPLGADRLFVAECLSRARKVVLSRSVVHGYRVRDGSMARASWNERKVISQCEYSSRSLAALCGSGKDLGRRGVSYLASLWLSDVPNRIARLPSGDRAGAWRQWYVTLGDSAIGRGLPWRFSIARALLRAAGGSMAISLALARMMRKGGIT